MARKNSLTETYWRSPIRDGIFALAANLGNLGGNLGNWLSLKTSYFRFELILKCYSTCREVKIENFFTFHLDDMIYEFTTNTNLDIDSEKSKAEKSKIGDIFDDIGIINEGKSLAFK